MTRITLTDVKNVSVNKQWFDAAGFMGDDVSSYQVVYIKELPWFYCTSEWQPSALGEGTGTIHQFRPINQDSFELGFTVECDPKKARETLLSSIYFDNLKSAPVKPAPVKEGNWHEHDSDANNDCEGMR